MRNLIFEENLGKEEFNSLALEEKSRVKAHFLGSYEWGKVSSLRNRTPYYTGVRENGRIVATALVLERSLVAGFTYFYIPRGFTLDYSDRELLKFMTESIRKMGKKHRALYFRIDPDIKLHTVDIDGNVIEGESNEDLVQYLEQLGYKHKPLNYAFENEQPRFTFRIPLGENIEEIEGRYSRTTKTRIRQSHEAGVTVCEGSAGDIGEFVRLMEMTEKRQGFYSHDPQFFRDFYEIMASADMARLYFGKVNVPQIIEKLESDKATVESELAELEGKTGKKAAGRIKEAAKKLTAIEKQLAGDKQGCIGAIQLLEGHGIERPHKGSQQRQEVT